MKLSNNSSIRSCANLSASRNSSKVCKAVLGLGYSGFAIHTAEQLKSLGWEVTSSSNAEEARRIAIQTKASVLVISVRSAEISDLLAMAKVVVALPTKTRVVIVAPSNDLNVESFVSHLGASYTAESDGVVRLIKILSEK